MDWYIGVLKKYAVFEGRARRKEYWMFYLFNFIISFGLGFVDGMLGLTNEQGTGALGAIYSLAVLVPSIAVGVRRMHDTDHSGWWLLLPIVNLVFLLTDGTRGSNRFGLDPKAGAYEYAGMTPAPVAPQPYGGQAYPQAAAPYQPTPSAAPEPVPPVATTYPEAAAVAEPAVSEPVQGWSGTEPVVEDYSTPAPAAPVPAAVVEPQPAAPATPQIPAGWHPDPTGRHQYRYWDSTNWTEHVSDNGATATDPL